MILWIFGVLAVFFVQTMLAPICQYLLHTGPHVTTALGPRDEPPPMPTYGARFDRALRNMMEALLIFLPLALLAEMKGIDGGITEMGAIVFFLARLAYPAAYVWGFSGLRSIVWGIGVVGLIMMVVGLWSYL